MRTLESGRMMLRANNTGVTAIIDTDGRAVSRLPNFVNGTLTGMAQGRTGATPYVRFGEWGVVLIVAIALLGVIAARWPVTRSTPSESIEQSPEKDSTWTSKP